MRDDHAAFERLGAAIVVITRHDAEAMRKKWREARLPYPGVADPEGQITARFGQQWKLFALGRMPAQVIVDCQGKVALAHYGEGMSDIIPNAEVLDRLRALRDGCPGGDGQGD